MADSIDRVFVHALNTVKKLPTTGAQRPPTSDRMRLYGLYKQAMEGDVDSVMPRPRANRNSRGSYSLIGGSPTTMSADELRSEQDKWDAWNGQKGLSRTEAKRRYIEALIDITQRYATTTMATELVTELEFVWDQIKGQIGIAGVLSSMGTDSLASSAEKAAETRDGDQSGAVMARSGMDVVATAAESRLVRRSADHSMTLLNPMSEEDASERRMGGALDKDDIEEAVPYNGGASGARRGWYKRMESALVHQSAEIAALREQIAMGREWRSRRERNLKTWLVWGLWTITKHVASDMAVLFVFLIWMRRQRDRRLEDHVRGTLRLVREYVRKVLPSR